MPESQKAGIAECRALHIANPHFACAMDTINSPANVHANERHANWASSTIAGEPGRDGREHYRPGQDMHSRVLYPRMHREKRVSK